MSIFEIATVISSAIKLVNALQNDRRAVQLSEIRKEILNQSKVLAITKTSLQTKIADEIRVLSDHRAELKRMKERSKVTMSKEDVKNQSLIDDLLAGTVFKVLSRHDKEIEFSRDQLSAV